LPVVRAPSDRKNGTIMIEIDFERLRPLGLTPALAAAAAATPASDAGAQPPLRLMRLTEVHRETVRLNDGEAECCARVWPRLARTLAELEMPLAVGDWVFAVDSPSDGCWVHERVAPLSHIVRRDGDGRRHALVSNVDTALLVMGLDDDFSPRRLERYLSLVQGTGVTPVLVLTKADVAAATPDRLPACLDALRGRVPEALPVFAVNATEAAAAQVLAPWLGAGQTLVLLGSSGAGKSTLTNTLLGAAVQDTGAVRAHDSRGKHTTTSRSLHRLPGGACVIDTPGLRTLRPDVDEGTLASAFEDIQSLALRCRFRDCRHHDEPGCAVRAGLNGDRLRNYHKLLREVRRDGLSVLERQRQLAAMKVRGRAGKARAKAKRIEQ
jgi:ribosome biogenesis GTPase